jgi:hypothetical protein
MIGYKNNGIYELDYHLLVTNLFSGSGISFFDFCSAAILSGFSFF